MKVGKVKVSEVNVSEVKGREDKGKSVRLRRIVALMISIAAIVTVVWTVIQANQPEKRVETGSIRAGAVAPDFEATNTAGDKVKLSDYRGKVVLLNFWASWCKPCVREMPLIHDIYQAQDSDVEALFVNVGESKGTITEYLEQQQFSFPVIIDVTGRLSTLYRIIGLPATFIVDKTGSFSHVALGEVSDSAQLNSWLADAKKTSE